MSRTVQLVGVDCGSTTTSLVAARARLTTTALGRVELSDVEPTFYSEVVFTPFDGQQIDAARLEKYLEGWLASGAVQGEELFGGGALITGLAAERSNAAVVAQSIESRLSGAVIAVADEPRLESWLAFMGNCYALSKASPQSLLVNLDIGGGTTNLAWGRDGQVLATGSLLVGARHFQFTPGNYQLREISAHGAKLLEHLQIAKRVGNVLTHTEVSQICDFYVELIVAAIGQDAAVLNTPIASELVQAPCSTAGEANESVAIALSGGVGGLAYRMLTANATEQPARFGDLGDELAQRLIAHPAIRGRLFPDQPEAPGRAVVFGLVRHSTELSGTTLYLPQPERLPLANVPILGRIGTATTDEQLRSLLQLVAGSRSAACLQVDLDANGENVRGLAERLAQSLARQPLNVEQTLVLLVPSNLGKLLGNYITQWGTRGTNLIVIDEVPLRDAHYLRLGRPREGVVPVWLHAVR